MHLSPHYFSKYVKECKEAHMFVKATWSFSSKTNLQEVHYKKQLRPRPYTAELLTYTRPSFFLLLNFWAVLEIS